MMTFTFMDLFLISPEIVLLLTACTVLVIDLFLDKSVARVTYYLAQIGLLIALILSLQILEGLYYPINIEHLVLDSFGMTLKAFILVIGLFSFIYADRYIVELGLRRGEFYAIALFSLLGMSILVSAQSILLLYLGLELLSLPLYALVTLKRESGIASEAGIKYFVTGALASGMLLYGLSLLYGITGTLHILEIQQMLISMESYNVVAVLGMVFVVVGMSFKLGAVPFHMWVPDIYQGAPTAVALFLGAAPKIAAFGMIVRLLIQGLETLYLDWQQLLAIMAVLSMILGNVAAIAQTNIKRLLAYSTISHVGFIFFGLLAGTNEGYSAAMFYVVTYALTSAGAFAMIILLSKKGFEAENIDDFKGLNARNSWYAFLMLILVFSLAGVPPTVGFYAKLSVLKSVIDIGQIWLAVIGVIFSVIGAFYYLRIIKVMYFDAPTDNSKIQSQTDFSVALSINALLVLLLGIFPGGLLTLCAIVF